MTASKEYNDFLKRFVDTNSGPKVGLVLAGGGVSAVAMALIPGSSRVLYEANILYDEMSTTHFLLENAIVGSAWNPDIPQKFVSGEMALALTKAAMLRYSGKCQPVVATSALTSHRHRKGDNVAFIGAPGQVWKLTLDKLPEAVYSDSVIPWREQKIANKRQAEDELVAEVAIKLATGFELDTLKWRMANGTLSRI